MSDSRPALVASAYGTMVDTWEAWRTQIEDDPRGEWCKELTVRLEAAARVVELLAGLFGRIHRQLRPGGLFLAALGASDLPGWTGDFLGAPTYFWGFPRGTKTRLLVAAGCALLRDELVTIRGPDGQARFHRVPGMA